MRTGALGSVGGLARLWSRSERRLRLLMLLVGLAVVIGVSAIFLLSTDFSDEEYWKTLGYPGVFFLSALGSAAMVLPVPGLVSVCALSLTLNPLLLGLLAGIGETLGEISGYAVGYGGGSVVEKHRFYPKLRHWMERRGTPILFLVSLIPNPVFDLIGITAGAVRFPLYRFLATVWVGKTMKGVMISYTCSYSFHQLPWVN